MRHFSIKELCKSNYAIAHGIDNTAPRKAEANLVSLITHVLDPLRDVVGDAIIVSSGYRCEAVNKAIGGKSNSQHMRGEAADIYCPSVSVRALLNAVLANGIPFDQMINEHDRWLHISYKSGNNRYQHFNAE